MTRTELLKAGHQPRGKNTMANLSKRDLTNLSKMLENHGAITGSEWVGTLQSERKMVSNGFSTKHVWDGEYVYQITAKGREAARSQVAS